MAPIMLRRREALLAATAAGLAFPARASASGVTAKGTVFDETGNARKGLANILVSNGKDVVSTDQDGKWSLPVDDGDSVFVIKPSGWMTPVDKATQLPRYSYLHDPGGTPAELGVRFRGVPPTGEISDSTDFFLHRQDEPAQFDALLLTDPQPESLAELGHVRDDVIAQLGDSPVAFGIGLGDIMFDDLALYGRYNRLAGTLGIPWHICPGNHDMNYEAPDNFRSRDTFKKTYGSRYHAFQYGGVTFLVLDNVEYLGTDRSRPLAAGKYRGAFGPRQLAFVRNLLAHVPADDLVVIAHHIPLHTLQSQEPANTNTDTAEFLKAIAGHRNCISFSGHTHTNEHWYLDTEGKPAAEGHHHHVLSAASGSWWSGPRDPRGIPAALATDGSPSGFHILSVDGRTATSRLVPSHDPSRGLLRIMFESQAHGISPEVISDYEAGALLSGPIDGEQVASTRVVVNFFEGGPRSVVEFSVGGGAFVPMQRVERIDPFVQDVYFRNRPTIKPWVKPELSSHIWQATLPATLQAGAHRIQVKARDEHGRPHAASSLLEIT